VVRVAFVGRAVEHGPWTLSAPAADVVPSFVDVRATTPPAELLDRLRDASPDVVVVLAPEHVPQGLLGEIDALKLAVVDEHVPGIDSTDVWHGHVHLDTELPEALRDYDRVAGTDPTLVRELGLWRSPPLAVDDALFAEELPPFRALHPLFVGESSPAREEWLVNPKHHYELSHYAYGLEGDALREVLATHNVGIVLRPTTGHATFPRTAALHLAAGHLLIAEPLRPPRGLEPGLDHLEIDEPSALMHVLYQCALRPAAFDYVRLRGRVRADELRASRIWPRIIADLRADVAAFA
jgi:hypothetical protein